MCGKYVRGTSAKGMWQSSQRQSLVPAFKLESPVKTRLKRHRGQRLKTECARLNAEWMSRERGSLATQCTAHLHAENLN